MTLSLSLSLSLIIFDVVVDDDDVVDDLDVLDVQVHDDDDDVPWLEHQAAPIK